MIKKIRLLIFLAIIALLVLAYLNSPLTENGEETLAGTINTQIKNVQDKIAERFPTLADDMEALMEDMNDRIEQIKNQEGQEPTEDIVAQEDTPSSIDTQSTPQTDELTNSEDQQLAQRIENLLEQIKKENPEGTADETTQDLLKLYENWRKLSKQQQPSPHEINPESPASSK